MSAPWNWVKDAFKWIAGAIEKIVKTIIDIVKDICETLWDWVKNVFHGVIETIKDVGKFIYHTVTFEIGKAFKDLYHALGDAVSIVGYTFDAIFKILDRLTFGLFSKVWDVLQKIISVIMICVCIVTGQVELALAMITTSLLAATGAVRDPVLLLIIAVTLDIIAGQAPIRRELLRLREKIGDFLHVDLDMVKWALSEGYIGWTDILKKYLGDVIGKIGEILDMTKEEIWGLLSNIASGIGGTVGRVYDALKDSINWVARQVKPLWNWVVDKVKYVYGWVGSNIEGVFNKIRWMFGSSIRTIADALSGVADWIYYRGNWLWNFVYNEIAKIWPTVRSAATKAWEYLVKIIRPVWDMVKSAAIKSWEYITSVIKPVWKTVKSVALKAWEYIEKVTKPFVNWVKKTIWPVVQDISKKLIEVSNWINERGREIYGWYAAHIKPYADKIVDLIHKAAIITEMVAAIRSGKVVRALLTGIGILGGKIEEVSRDILKFYDGTLTSILKGVGYGIGWVRKMISDLYTSASRIAKDVAKMGINVGWKVLNDMGKFIADVAKATLGKVYVKIGDVDKTVREWISYLKEPVTRALSIIYQTHAEFHKYDYAYRAAYLRQLSTVTGRPFHYLFLPRVLFEKP